MRNPPNLAIILHFELDTFRVYLIRYEYQNNQDTPLSFRLILRENIEGYIVLQMEDADDGTARPGCEHCGLRYEWKLSCYVPFIPCLRLVSHLFCIGVIIRISNLHSSNLRTHTTSGNMMNKFTDIALLSVVQSLLASQIMAQIGTFPQYQGTVSESLIVRQILFTSIFNNRRQF